MENAQKRTEATHAQQKNRKGHTFLNITGDIENVMRIHRSIIGQYKLDFMQYESEDRKLMIPDVHEKIPSELNEKNKCFKIADFRKSIRYDRVEESSVWLWKAGIALGVFNTTEPAVPLMLKRKNTLFKLIVSDAGLLTTLYENRANSGL